MKKYIIFFVGLLFTGLVFGQNETKMLGIDEVEIIPPKFTESENVIVLEDNKSSLIKNYIVKNVDYPIDASGWLYEGTEIVSFTVTPSGDLIDFNIVNGVSPDIDDEVLRVLRTTDGMWKPGYRNGIPTEMEQEVTVLFGYNDHGNIIDHFVKQATIHFIQGSKNFMLKNKPEKAIKLYTRGVRYLPNDNSLLMMRGMCYYELGETEKAKADWNRLASLGGTITLENQNKLIGMSGYEEMITLLTNNK